MEVTVLRLFVDVMRRGSFAAVARDHDTDPSSVSRAIATLEEELGARLFQRSTRRLQPTEAGLAYFARVEPIVDELEHARHLAGELSDHPQGTLRVTAPVTFAQINLVQFLPEFARDYPDLSLELLFTDAMLDLLAERIDVAIRLGPLSNSNLVAHRLCNTAYCVSASPGYLRQHGRPQTPRDVEHHNCLLFPLTGFRSRWRFRDDKGKIADVPVHGHCIISNSLALRTCAVADMGVTLLPRWLVTPDLRSGALVDLFPDHRVTATEFDTAAWVLYPSRTYLPLKVRVFLDFLKRKFAAGAPGEQPT
jgi:DNA-binding transcriptional LysR family regulator